jgi:hypothetical protein
MRAIGLKVFIIFIFCRCTYAADTLEAFSQRIREAHLSRDPEKLRSLYNTIDAKVFPRIAHSIDLRIADDLTEPPEIVSITFIPPSPQDTVPDLQDGMISYLPRKPEGSCRIEFGKNDSGLLSSTTPFSKIDNQYYFLAEDSIALSGVPKVMDHININVEPTLGGYLPTGIVIFKAGKAISWKQISNAVGFRATEIISICIPPSPMAHSYKIRIAQGIGQPTIKEFDASHGVNWTVNWSAAESESKNESK